MDLNLYCCCDTYDFHIWSLEVGDKGGMLAVPLTDKHQQHLFLPLTPQLTLGLLDQRVFSLGPHYKLTLRRSVSLKCPRCKSKVCNDNNVMVRYGCAQWHLCPHPSLPFFPMPQLSPNGLAVKQDHEAHPFWWVMAVDGSWLFLLLFLGHWSPMFSKCEDFLHQRHVSTTRSKNPPTKVGSKMCKNSCSLWLLAKIPGFIFFFFFFLCQGGMRNI